jgi:hypothetical protein
MRACDPSPCPPCRSAHVLLEEERVSAHRGPRQLARRAHAADGAWVRGRGRAARCEVIGRVVRSAVRHSLVQLRFRARPGRSIDRLRRRASGSVAQFARQHLVRSVRAAPELPRPSMGRGTRLFQKRMRRPAGWAGARIAGAHPFEGSDDGLPVAVPGAARPQASRCRSTLPERSLAGTALSAGEPSPCPTCQRDHARTERPARSAGQLRRGRKRRGRKRRGRKTGDPSDTASRDSGNRR